MFKKATSILLFLSLCILSAVPAFAVGDPPYKPLYDAFDTSTLLTSITGLAVVGVTVQLIYVGWKHIRKGGNKI